MSITTEQIEREKKTLPFGWGRFGKAYERLAEISEPDESLLASCVALNPEYQYKPRFVPGSVLSTGHALHELTKATNVVLASTSERLIMISTGARGTPRARHDSLRRPRDRLAREEGVRARPARWADARPRRRQAAGPGLPRLLGNPGETSRSDRLITGLYGAALPDLLEGRELTPTPSREARTYLTPFGRQLAPADSRAPTA
jgi:hypothetical protein